MLAGHLVSANELMKFLLPVQNGESVRPRELLVPGLLHKRFSGLSRTLSHRNRGYLRDESEERLHS